MYFPSFFAGALEGNPAPFPYQRHLAETNWPETLIIPTGFGKTAAVLGAWLWKSACGDPQTLRRLVYCLPMRTLVEQTAATAERWTKAARRDLGLRVETGVLVGGQSDGRRGAPRWMLDPDRPTILIGTQDLVDVGNA